MISSSNEQLLQQLDYTRTKTWLSRLVNFENVIRTLEERYGIKFYFKLGKNAAETYEIFRLLLEHLAWIEHRFLSDGIRDSRKAGTVWGMMRDVGGVRKSIYHSWLTKGLGLGLLCWGFKGFQQEIPKEEPSTFQMGSVVFPSRKCTSTKLHPCHRLYDQDRP